MTNGNKTYSKTPFSEKKHKRGLGGTFETKAHTEESTVEYHHDFDAKSHHRGKDGSFNSYSSDAKTENDSDYLKNGKSRYGSNE